jgi:hypothetical protein
MYTTQIPAGLAPASAIPPSAPSSSTKPVSKYKVDFPKALLEQQHVGKKVDALQKTSSITSAVRAVEQRKNSPEIKIARHRELTSQAPKTPAKSATPVSEKTVKSVERKIAKSHMAAKSKEKEKGSSKDFGEKLWEVDKVLAVPEAMAAADDPRLGLIGRLTAYATTTDTQLRGDIADLTLSEIAQTRTSTSTTANTDTRSCEEVEAVIGTPRLLQPYISHCRREVALSGELSDQAVRLANATLQIAPPPPPLPGAAPNSAQSNVPQGPTTSTSTTTSVS